MNLKEHKDPHSNRNAKAQERGVRTVTENAHHEYEGSDCCANCGGNRQAPTLRSLPLNLLLNRDRGQPHIIAKRIKLLTYHGKQLVPMVRDRCQRYFRSIYNV